MKRMTALVVSVTLLLTACGSGTPEPTEAPIVPVTAARPDGLSLRTESRGWEISLYLDGYKDRTPPALTVAGLTGQKWADNKRTPVNTTGASFRMSLAAERYLAAELISYTWVTGAGEELTGEFVFSSPLAPLPWQVTKTDQFVLFHVDPLEPGEAEAYEAAYGRVVEWSGQRVEPGSVIYLFPDHDSLLKFGEALGKQPPLDGFSTKDRIYLRGGLPVGEKVRVMAHEMVHVIGASSPTVWIREGVAGYFSMHFRDRLKTLQELAQDGWQVNLHEVTRAEPPGQDADTVGVAFMLFLRSREGHEGVQRLLATLRAGELVSFNAVEAVMGADMETLQREFQGYLESGQMLEDAKALFGI